jgi:hypothetical protein
MIMADILFWFLVIAGIYLVLIAHWLSAQALFPRLVDHARANYGRKPITATLLGLLIAIPTLVLAIALFTTLPHPAVRILVILALMVPLLLSLLGSAGLAARIGAGLPAPTDGIQPWKQVLRGGVVLGLIFVMPILGWFLILPLTMVSGLGVAVMALRASAKLASEPVTAARPSPAIPVPAPGPVHAASDTVATVFVKP